MDQSGCRAVRHGGRGFKLAFFIMGLEGLTASMLVMSGAQGVWCWGLGVTDSRG